MRSPILQHALVVLSFWCIAMVEGNKWSLFVDNFFMTITMAFGSFIAGSTSEGGGAVAFPVMTIFAGISPSVARDFSLMIQSVGMSAAALTILRESIKIELRAILLSGLGGILGIILGFEVLAPLLPAAATKLVFVSLWLVFSLVLFLRLKIPLEGKIQNKLSYLSSSDALRLAAIGFVGGLITGISGSGIDIVTFLLLVLFYNLDERVATATSVVLMAAISVIGFYWRSLSTTVPIADQAWNYWWVSVPVVVFFAPLGAKFIQTRSRQFVIKFLLLSAIVQFVAAQLLIPQTLELACLSFFTIIFGFFFTWFIGISSLTSNTLLMYAKTFLSRNVNNEH